MSTAILSPLSTEVLILKKEGTLTLFSRTMETVSAVCIVEVHTNIDQCPAGECSLGHVKDAIILLHVLAPSTAPLQAGDTFYSHTACPGS